jgi:hypothetical protein
MRSCISPLAFRLEADYISGFGARGLVDQEELEPSAPIWFLEPTARTCLPRRKASAALNRGDSSLPDDPNVSSAFVAGPLPLPPFSSMNSAPAASKACRIAKSLAVVSEVASFAASARRIVFTPKDERRARSSAPHFNSARADLIWPPVNADNFSVDSQTHVAR